MEWLSILAIVLVLFICFAPGFVAVQLYKRFRTDNHRCGYLQAIYDMEMLMLNARENRGGIFIENSRFIESAHWDYEIEDQLMQLRVEYGREKK